MLVVEGNGLPIGLHVDSAAPHELKLAEATLGTIRVPRRRGRPRTRPRELVADKAYDSRAFRQALRRRGIKPTIPTFKRRPDTRPKPGRPMTLSDSFADRWKVERTFGWMDNCRRLVVRYDRYLHCYKAFCIIAIILWCVNAILK
jgi:transposase